MFNFLSSEVKGNTQKQTSLKKQQDQPSYSFQFMDIEDPQQFTLQKIQMKQQNIICRFCYELIKIQILSDHQLFCQQEYLNIIKLNFTKQCQYCTNQFLQEQLQDHYTICPMKISNCSHCNQIIIGSMQSFNEHQLKCINKNLKNKNKMFNSYQSFKSSQYLQNACKWCQQIYNKQQLSQHYQSCIQRLQILHQLSDQPLSQIQYLAMQNMYDKSASQNLKSKSNVLETLFKMGFGEQDLMLMNQFIQFQAPLIIHFNLTKSLKDFLNDTCYRSLFQTNKSGGSNSSSNRIQWEQHLFGNSYDNCQPFQRVKYGVINYANDKFGMLKCRQYGSSTIILKSHVRKRCTISHQRTYSSGEIVGTLKYCYPILEKCSDIQLRTLYMASKGFQVDSTDLASFKQIQIHGPIRFSEDIDCIYAPKSEINQNFKQVQEFINKFGVEIIALEDLMDNIY